MLNIYIYMSNHTWDTFPLILYPCYWMFGIIIFQDPLPAVPKTNCRDYLNAGCVKGGNINTCIELTLCKIRSISALNEDMICQILSSLCNNRRTETIASTLLEMSVSQRVWLRGKSDKLSFIHDPNDFNTRLRSLWLLSNKKKQGTR